MFATVETIVIDSNHSQSLSSSADNPKLINTARDEPEEYLKTNALLSVSTSKSEGFDEGRILHEIL